MEIISTQSKNAFNLMDIWIGDTVKAENDFVNEIINSWKISVKDRINSNLTTIKRNSVISEYLTELN